MKRTYFLLPLAAALVAVVPQSLRACTGITLRAADGTGVVARTIEWGGSDLNSRYVVVPRGYARRSFTPDGMDGMLFTARYGYVGLSVEREEFVAEGLNEEGLSAGLFYFPGYGEYEAYDPARKEESIADLQLVSLVLGACRTIDEVKELLGNVRVIGIDPRASTVHWRFADVSGRQVVLEIVDRHAVFYENELGVLTNSPGFEWQLTNLNNYVNLYPGSAPERRMEGVRLAAFGAGSGMLGLPGDGLRRRAAMFPDTQQFRYSGRGGVPAGRASGRYSERHAVDLGDGSCGPDDLLPHDVRQYDPQHRPACDRLRTGTVSFRAAGRGAAAARRSGPDRIAAALRAAVSITAGDGAAGGPSPALPPRFESGSLCREDEECFRGKAPAAKRRQGRFLHGSAIPDGVFSGPARRPVPESPADHSTVGNSIVSLSSFQSVIVKSPGLPSGRISPITTLSVSSVLAESEEFRVCVSL